MGEDTRHGTWGSFWGPLLHLRPGFPDPEHIADIPRPGRTADRPLRRLRQPASRSRRPPLAIPPPGSWPRSWPGRDSRSRRSLTIIARRLREIVPGIGRDPSAYGVIHADFHGSNLIYDSATLHILDSEDCGWGHWLADRAWPVVLYAKAHGSSRAFFQALLHGYETMSSRERELLPVFLAGTGLAAMELVFHASIPLTGPMRPPMAREWYAFAIDRLQRCIREEAGVGIPLA